MMEGAQPNKFMNPTPPSAKTRASVKPASDNLLEVLTREVGGCLHCGRKRLLTDVAVCWACPSLFREDGPQSPFYCCPRNN